jgi:hypothetical protein
MLASAAFSRPGRTPAAEEMAHSPELVTMTAVKTAVPDKREGSVKRREKGERDMSALLVKVKHRRHKRSSRQVDGTETCCDVGWQPDRTVVSIWRKRRIVRNTSNKVLVKIDDFLNSRIAESLRAMEPTEEYQFVTGTRAVALADTRICGACLPCVLHPRTNKIGSCALRGVDESGGELGWGIHARPGRKRRVTVWNMPMGIKSPRTSPNKDKDEQTC